MAKIMMLFKQVAQTQVSQCFHSDCVISVLFFLCTLIGLGATSGCGFARPAHSSYNGADDTGRSEELLAFSPF